MGDKIFIFIVGVIVPLAWFPTVEAFVVPKIIAALVGCVWGVYMVCRTCVVDRAILALVVWSSICVYMSASPARGVIGWGNDRTTGLSTILLCSLIYAIARARRVRITHGYMRLTGVISAIVGLTQLAVNLHHLIRYVLDGRPVGPSGGPTYLGMLLAMCLPAAMSRPYVASIIIAGLVSTGSAGAWIGAGAGVACIYMDGITRRGALIAALAVAVGLGVYSLRSDPLRSQAGRLQAWRAAAAVTQAHPLWGMGPSQYQVPAPANGPGKWHRHAHNDILEAAATIGIPGALIYLLAWAAALWRHRGTVTGAMLLTLFVALKFNPPGVEHLILAALLAGSVPDYGRFTPISGKKSI